MEFTSPSDSRNPGESGLASELNCRSHWILSHLPSLPKMSSFCKVSLMVLMDKLATLPAVVRIHPAGVGIKEDFEVKTVNNFCNWWSGSHSSRALSGPAL